MSWIAARPELAFSKPRSVRLALPLLAVSVLAMLPAPASAGCNSGPLDQNHMITTDFCLSEANGALALALGVGANANGELATSLGSNSGPAGVVTAQTSVGAYAGRLAGIYAISVGAGHASNEAAQAKGSFSVAIGAGDDPSRPGAVAAGTASISIGHRSIATGSGYASALGYNARADVGLGPTTMGTDSRAAGTNASAFGRFAAATSGNATAIGAASRARFGQSTAIGATSDAAAAGASAFGFGARALTTRSVAIGAGSVANIANTVSVGKAGAERRIVNVAKAVNATDAVNLAQVKALIAAAVAAQ